MPTPEFIKRRNIVNIVLIGATIYNLIDLFQQNPTQTFIEAIPSYVLTFAIVAAGIINNVNPNDPDAQ